jgi:anti-sigma factor RsiW
MAELLPRLPDDDLSAQERALVQAHLEGCETCRAQAEAQQRISLILREEPAPDTGLPTGAQAAAWIMQRERQARPWWLHLRLAWASLGAAVVIAAAVFFVAPGSVFRPSAAREVTAPVIQAPQPLPALVISDDEDTGRQVLLALPARAE